MMSRWLLLWIVFLSQNSASQCAATTTTTNGVVIENTVAQLIPSKPCIMTAWPSMQPTMESLRGGGKGNRESSPQSPPVRALDSAATTTASTIQDFAVSLWILTRRVANQHVVPMVRDPHGRIIRPIQSILQDPHGRIVQPLHDFVQRTAIEANETRASYSESPSHAISVVFIPTRILKLSIAAWCLAEFLDYCGIVTNGSSDSSSTKEETTSRLQAQLHRLWYRAQPKVQEVQTKVQRWWTNHPEIVQLLRPSTWSSKEQLSKALEDLPAKYQFAMGASLGMITSPILWSVSSSVFPPLAVLCGLAELNHRFKQQNPAFHLKHYTGGDNTIGATIDHYLEQCQAWMQKWIGRTIRSFARRPREKFNMGSTSPLVAPSEDVPEETEDTTMRPVGTSSYSLGIGPTSLNHTTPKTYLDQWQAIRQHIVDSMTETQPLSEYEGMSLMIYKGIIIGGLVGLLVGL